MIAVGRASLADGLLLGCPFDGDSRLPFLVLLTWSSLLVDAVLDLAAGGEATFLEVLLRVLT